MHNHFITGITSTTIIGTAIIFMFIFMFIFVFI